MTQCSMLERIQNIFFLRLFILKSKLCSGLGMNRPSCCVFRALHWREIAKICELQNTWHDNFLDCDKGSGANYFLFRFLCFCYVAFWILHLILITEILLSIDMGTVSAGWC